MRETLGARAAIVAAFTAIIHAAVVLGFAHWTTVQEVALSGAVDAAGLAVAIAWGRAGVTPLSDPRTNDGRPLVPAPGVPPATPAP